MSDEKSSKINIDLSGRAGLAPKFYGDFNDSVGQPQFRYLAKAGQFAQGVFNPARKYGYLTAPTYVATNITAVSGAMNNIRTTIFDSGTGYYYLGDNIGQIWYGATPTTYSLTQIGPMAGSTPVMLDYEIYQINGVKKLFYAYKNDAKTDIGISSLPFTSGTGTDAWFSSVASGAVTTIASDCFMVVADNGYMYVVAGSTSGQLTPNSVFKVDGTSLTGGTNGTITQALIAPTDFNIVDGISWKGFVWFAMQTCTFGGFSSQTTYNERIVGVYIWDRQTTIANMQDFIPMFGAREIRKLYVTRSGKVRAITISSDRFTQIREYNGNSFEVIATLGINAWPQYRDSLTQDGAMTIWLGADGKIYGHGKLTEDDNEATYILGDMTTAFLSGNFTTGAVLFLDSSGSSTTTRIGLLWSGRTAVPTQNVKVWYPNGEGTINASAQFSDSGNVYTPVATLPGLAKVNYLRVFHFPQVVTGTTAAGTLTYYLNQSTAGVTTTITRNDLALGYKYIKIGKTGVRSIQFKMTFDTNVVLGSVNEWLPRMLEVDWTPESKLL